MIGTAKTHMVAKTEATTVYYVVLAGAVAAAVTDTAHHTLCHPLRVPPVPIQSTWLSWWRRTWRLAVAVCVGETMAQLKMAQALHLRRALRDKRPFDEVGAGRVFGTRRPRPKR